MRRSAVSLVEVIVVVVILGVLLALVLPAFFSSGESSHADREAPRRGAYPSSEKAPPPAVAGMPVLAAEGKYAARDGNAAEGVAQAGAGVHVGLDRKIVYRAQVELAVEDFAGVSDRVLALIKKFDGYVADSTLSGSSGETRRGSWTIRVPVARFEEFVGAAKGLGELIQAGTSSQDVSEEYYDVEARIRNKTKEEQRLLALLEERPGDLKDVIAIERELSRVREELERMQGRMRVLTDLTALTTVQLTISEIKGYQPPESPTLATRMRRSFEGSVEAIQGVGEGLLIGAVSLAPWLPVGLVLGTPLLLAVRRARRQTQARD